MFIFIKGWYAPKYTKEGLPQGDLVNEQRAYKIEDIAEINSVIQTNGKFRFSMLVRGIRIYSSLYPTQEEAEMAQVSSITTLNALELYYDRYKHVPEHYAAPVEFFVVDAKQRKLQPARISKFETPVYTIDI